MDDRLRILDTDALSLAQRSHPVVVKRLKALPPKQRGITIISKAQQRFEQLKRLKLRMGTLDMRIAAIALEKDAILVTSNLQDFSKVPNLAIEDWSIAEEAVE